MTKDSIVNLSIGETLAVNLTLNANTHLIKGLVRDSALTDTLGGVSVYITGVDSQVTGPSGTYDIWVDTGTYTLHFRHPGYLDKDSVVTVLPAVDTLTVNARLRPNFATLAGHVRDGMSSNLDSVLIAASGTNGTWTGHTAASGLYSITGMYPGLYTVTAHKVGYTPVPVSIDSILAGRATTTLDFTLHSNNGTITGTVKQDSATGAAVAIASVQAQDYATFITYPAVTDSAGNYTITGLPTLGNPEYRVTTYKAGFTALAASVAESVNAGDIGVALVLYKNDGIISGIAYLDSLYGPGVGGRTVTIEQVGGPTYNVNTAANGAFCKSDLPPTEANLYYQISIEALNGYTTPATKESVQADSTGLAFVFVRQTRTVSGTVRNDAGAVLPGANVVVYDYATALEYSNVTNGSGVFTVGGLPSLSEFRVSVSAPGYTSLDSSVVESVYTNTAGLRLKLYINDGIVSGFAYRDSTGTTGMGGKTVTFARAGGGSYQVNTQANGAFSKTDLPPEEAGYAYIVTIDAEPGYTVQPDSHAIRADSTGLVFRYIRNQGAISGRVADDLNVAIQNANVVVYEYSTGLEYNDMTDPLGNYSISGLPSLTKFRVSVSASGYTGLDSSVLESVATNASNVKLKLYINDGIITGTVYRDSVNGNPVVGDTVIIHQLGGGIYNILTNTNGIFTKNNLPPRETNYYYNVSVQALAGFRTPAIKESLQANTTGLNFIYIADTANAYVLKVRVLYTEDSLPVATARIFLENKDKNSSRVNTTSVTGVAVFTNWAFLLVGDSLRVTSIKYGATNLDVIDNFTLDAGSETTYVTLYLDKSLAIVSSRYIAYIDSQYTYQVPAPISYSGLLTFLLVTKPNNMAINAMSGLIQWTPSASSPATESVKVKIRDGVGDSTDQSFVIIVVNIANLSTQTINHLSFGSEQTAYTLFSFPYYTSPSKLADILASQFGAYDKKRWRAYQLENNSYKEYPGLGEVLPGESYWFISREKEEINANFGSVVTDNAYRGITIPAGQWKFIATPYPFDIKWHDVLDSTVKKESLSVLYEYSGQWKNVADSTLRKNQGYAVYNRSHSAITLVFPRIPAGSSIYKATQQYNDFLTNCGVKFLVQCQEARDEYTFIGWSDNASDGFDLNDQPEPLPIGGYVAAYFAHRDWTLPNIYTSDVRPLSGNGKTWNLTVESNIENAITDIKWEINYTKLPSGMEAYLYDAEGQTATNMTGGSSYAIATGSGITQKSLKVVVGTPGYIQSQLGTIRGIPEHTILEIMGANPFQAQAKVRYYLNAPQLNMALSVVDAQGWVIRVVTQGSRNAGYYTASWDGENTSGQRVQPGVYYFYLQAGSKVLAKSMVMIK